MIRSRPWLASVRQIGYPAALVAQDGLTVAGVPWAEIDALFLGGTTDFKLSDDARALADAARSRGKWLHMGRVNSLRRLHIAKAFGCDSVDGTYLSFGPAKNLPKLTRWLAEVNG